MGDSFISKVAPKIVSWETGTDAEILAMVESDRAGLIDLRDYWSVGDTRTVSLSEMDESSWTGDAHSAQDVEFVLMDNVCTGFTWAETPISGITVPRFIVGMKNCLNEDGCINTTASNVGGWRDSARRIWCNSDFYSAIPSSLRNIFKIFSWSLGIGGGEPSGLYTMTDIIALPPDKCVQGSGYDSQEDEALLYSQWEWYQTASNRLKAQGIYSPTVWWHSSPRGGWESYYCCTYADDSSYYPANYQYGLSPFGCI